ncbi:HhH-GPD-type base excision DNA repair protein [Nocardioides currus]|uniref:Fe-S cluster assembly protein HesB n=1 Tax=Nocardioides currus TaxID=2133958 RepID=A0A2R7YTS0_9ACTN|nr:HhH-GPD-type base excision DNA repair protein [Nocardioides currus]PUA79693.1 Fe-S cluster assembly protein HesB [Nocardioides currus]
MAIQITGDAAADQILDESSFALLAGMMLDQQYPMEHAFRGPAKVTARFGSFDPAAIAAADPEEFAAMAATTPAIHRFPGSMSTKLQELARIVTDDYDGDASRLWTEASDAKDLLRRIMALPGFGKQKAQIFVALLAKQRGVRPDGWEGVVGDYALDGYRSVADVVDPASLQKVRDYKKQKKAAAKSTAGAGAVD